MARMKSALPALVVLLIPLIFGCENPLGEIIEEKVKEYSGKLPQITIFDLSGNSITNDTTVGFTFDGNNISAWLITETSEIPSVDDPLWSSDALGSYILPENDGEYTLYAWGKDAEGSISAPLSVTVTLDSTAPVIGTFEFTDLVSSYTTQSSVALTLAGSEDIDWWAVTLSNSPPPKGTSEWKSEKPVDIDLSKEAEGSKSIYVWALDTAGNTN
ncbi:MAG: hypothetical protein HN368_22605, partial [Spirochaetales bacterium]|nr:hypothetical protein [Spirochaetales bacterium]